jgi:AcrR family transcriptional regulator
MYAAGMERDAAATRARLLRAGRAEFAEYGIAGARVDRIAAASGSNKAQIYHYFSSKQGLFDAVFTAIVRDVGDLVPLDVTDLPGYAASLVTAHDAEPDIMRLATWHRLERGGSPIVDAARDSSAVKVEQIRGAQAAGIVTRRYPAGTILAFILQLSATWVDMPDELRSATEVPGPAARASLVEEATRALLAVD